jgi:hypothetical protein
MRAVRSRRCSKASKAKNRTTRPELRVSDILCA